MTTFTDKIRANKQGYSERLAEYGAKDYIKDFADFKEALINELSGTPQGQGAINFLSEEELVELFKQPNVREKIVMNVGEEEANEIYMRAERTDFVVTRKVKLGKPTKQRDIKLWVVGKPIKSKGYVRKGKTITGYSRAYNRWTSPQTNYLKQQRTLLKQKKITTSQIAFEYNKEFKDNPRSSSSIQSKLYRI
jgi:hypothetical protein